MSDILKENHFKEHAWDFQVHEYYNASGWEDLLRRMHKLVEKTHWISNV